MFRFLVPQIGFPWTVRCIGFVFLALYLLSYLVLLGPQPEPRAVRRFFDTSAFTSLPFMMLSIASLFSATAFYIPFLYLPLLTRVRDPSIGPDMMLDLVPILNGASVVGRLLSGLVAAVFGPTEVIAAAAAVGSLLLFCWIAVENVAGVVVWSVFWGIISGVLVTLPGAIIPLFCPSLAVIGTRSGMYWSWVGLGMLIGSPIGGAIYDVRTTTTDYWHLQVFAGFFMMGAAAFTIYPVIYIRRRARNVSRGTE